ncbi:uncharacterized protein LOC129899773 [Solanum dulcamara]|uniref:uncharacterized protein LOC129899773 n=1 Tax=Solanum dulcamara TaxID=45834 RepID=UPI002484E4A3|nr:uncharacterized protein LOC129899773 [Solanum dulcamara]
MSSASGSGGLATINSPTSSRCADCPNMVMTIADQQFYKRFQKMKPLQFQGAIPGVPRIDWMGTNGSYPSKSISYIHAQRLIDIVCMSYLAFIRDTSVELPPMESILIVKEFADVFSNDLSGVPSNRDIDFAIDLKPGTKPISIPPYRMTSAELKELKDQLQDLLSKGFIRPSVSP